MVFSIPFWRAFRVLLEYDITSGKYKWMDGKDPIAVWNKHKVGLTRSVMDLAGSLGDKPTVFGKDPAFGIMPTWYFRAWRELVWYELPCQTSC